MLFNSIEFLLFFVVVFFFYWKILSKSYAKQNLLLLCSSYFFYGWWDWRFLSLIIFSSFVDYFVGQKLGTVKDQTYRMYVRRDIKSKAYSKMSPLINEILLEKGCLSKYSFNGVTFGLIHDLEKVCEIIKHDLKTKGGLIKFEE